MTEFIIFVILQFIVIIILTRRIRINKVKIQSLATSQNQYKSLFTNLQEGFALHEIVCNASGKPINYRFLDVNQAFESFTQLKKADIINELVLDVLPDTEEYWIEMYGDVALEGKVMTFEAFSGALGKHFSVTAFSPKVGQFATVFFDITERKKLEEDLRAEKERLRITLLSVGDGVISTDKEGKVEFMNGVAEHLTGWSQHDAQGEEVNHIFHILHEKTRALCQDPVRTVLESGQTVELANHTALIAKDGVERSIADSAAPIIDSEGRIQGVVLVFRDVTAERIRHNEIEYLSYHDSLTGVYNRRFFEEELRRLNVGRNLPLSIIVGDVNGLKLMNDAFGHLTGDQLLQKVADAFNHACRADDIIARWGGDEFVVILPKTNPSDVVKIMQRIKDVAAETEVESIPLSISLGFETKVRPEQDIIAILKAAESNMYKIKLHESQSMINKAICAIHGTLLAKNEREAQHSRRVADICKDIALAMEMPVSTVNEMETIGLMHDIGKIAIKEAVLEKTSKLTDDEWNELKRHPEVGYRILSASNETAEIANCVLAHHERYDGSGYPAGLKGEDIPLESRILAVADAFAAMTSDRAYKKPMSQRQAIDELKNNVGTQFDPHIVNIFVEKCGVARD